MTNAHEGTIFVNQSEEFDIAQYAQQLFPLFGAKEGEAVASTYRSLGFPLEQADAIMGEGQLIVPSFTFRKLTLLFSLIHLPHVCAPRRIPQPVVQGALIVRQFFRSLILVAGRIRSWVCAARQRRLLLLSLFHLPGDGAQLQQHRFHRRLRGGIPFFCRKPRPQRQTPANSDSDVAEMVFNGCCGDDIQQNRGRGFVDRGESDIARAVE